MATEPTADNATVRFIAHKPPKRRASQACLECRRRKVRCDIVTDKSGACTNCRLDGVVCEVGPRKRRRKNEEANVAPPTPQSIVGSDTTTVETDQACRGRQDEGNFVSHVARSFAFGATPRRDRSPDIGSPHTLHGSAAAGEHVTLPPFIKPLSENLHVEDCQYLSAKRCFSFPPPALETYIVRRFIDFVYPLLPVLDVDDLVAIITGHSQKQISLLLYHALMSAGLAAVEIDVIREHGYESKSAARDDFYTRAKALHEIDAESDRLVTCQAALLFVSWSRNSDDSRDALYWVGVALNQGYSISLQKIAASVSTSTDANSDQQLKRRIWWTIVMKESDVCLSMGKPPRIVPHDIPMLEHQDFGIPSPQRSWTDDIGGAEMEMAEWHVPMKNHLLQEACIEKAKLSVIAHKVLRFLHTVHRGRDNSRIRSSTVWELDAELRDWRHSLPTTLWQPSNPPAACNDNNRHRHAQLTVSMAKLSYLMTVILLHKPEVPVAKWADPTFEVTDFCNDELCRLQTHVRTMRRAADDMTAIHKVLHECGLTGVVPSVGVATICTAISVHLLDARSAQEAVHTRSLEQLDVCLKVLGEVGSLNYTAAEIVKLAESAVRDVRGLRDKRLTKIRELNTAGKQQGRQQQPVNEQQSHYDETQRNLAKAGGAPCEIPDDSVFSSTSLNLWLEMEHLFRFVGV